MHDYVDELQQCGNSTQCATDVQKKYDEMDEKQREELVDACSTNPSSSACFNQIKNAVEGGVVLVTEADLLHPLGEMGQYPLSEACQGAPSNCSDILAQQDAKNQLDADYNLNNPIIIAERASDARAILGYLGINTTEMTDKEVVDKVTDIGYMASAGIMGAGKARVNLANDLTKNPLSIWGKSTTDIVKDFQAAGYQVNVRQSSRGSGQAVIVEIKGHPEISQIQYHPGGGRHGGSYYKVSTTTQGTIKVVDSTSYKPTPGEKATIIDKPKE